MILIPWVGADPQGAWDWMREALDAGRLQTMEKAGVIDKVAYALGSGLPEQIGVRPAFDALFDLSQSEVNPNFSELIRHGVGALREEADFLHALGRARDEVGSVEARAKLVDSVMRQWGKADWNSGLAWVKTQGGAAQQAELGWSLGFPPIDKEALDLKAHAEWLLSLDADPHSSLRRKIADQIMRGWFVRQPQEAGGLLVERGMVDRSVVIGVVTQLRTHAETPGWRQGAIQLLRACDSELRGTPSQWDSFAVGDDEAWLAALEGLFEEVEGGE